jgi:hypothetical protein
MPTPPSSNPVDKFGREYLALLDRQKSDLDKLQQILKPEAFSTLRDWCDITNAPAIPLPPGTRVYTAGGLHSVPVGQSLLNFLLEMVPPEEVIVPDQPKTKHGKAHRSNRTHR